MSAGHPEQELIRRAQSGDKSAFAALCERYRSRLWRLVASLSQGADADDLAQDAIIKAFCSIRSYRAEASFETWLCKIALNTAHDHRKSAWKRRVTLQELEPEETGGKTPRLEGEVERREVQRRVRFAVSMLPERQRVPIWLHYFEGFSVAEMARLERESESTIRSRIRAGLKKLSKTLDDLSMPYSDKVPNRVPETKGCIQ